MKQVGLIGLIVAMIFLASCTKNEEETVAAVMSDTSAGTSQVAQEGVMSDPVVLGANYEDYNEGSLGEANNTVIFFHAPYCGSCTQTDKNLKESGLGEDVKVLKADFDTSLDLRKKYGVTKYHTFVQVDENGDMVKKWSGSMDASDITENVDAMMKDDAMMDGEAMMDNGEAMMEKEETMMKDDAMMDGEAMAGEIEEDPVALAGTYADYSSELVGNSDTTLIFFHANWCPSCRSLDDAIGSSEVPEGITILKADFDSETDLRSQYGVVSQHTIVQVDSDGNEVKKWLGGNSMDDILERVQ